MGRRGRPAGPTGHPLPNQTVEVRPVLTALTSVTGFTGARGTRVGVSLDTSAGTPVVLRFWQTKTDIPADALVPCTGSGVVSFVPDPTSPTARRAAVEVGFFRVLA